MSDRELLNKWATGLAWSKERGLDVRISSADFERILNMASNDFNDRGLSADQDNART